MKGISPEEDPDCESPRSFVSAHSDLDRASVKTGDWEARSPRRSSMDAVAEEGQVPKTGTQRLQLSPTATALLRQARIALTGELFGQRGLTRAPCTGVVARPRPLPEHSSAGPLHARLGHRRPSQRQALSRDCPRSMTL